MVETKRTRLVNMITASDKDVAQRVKEGFLGLLVPNDEVIKAGRAAAGR
jgi:hypothetical protein